MTEVEVKHKVYCFDNKYVCGYCGKEFKYYYKNRRGDYLGNRGRYNFAGAAANFNRHIDACKKRYLEVPK